MSVLALLLLLLLLHHATARDTPQETHITEKIDFCPDVGYYFTRDSNPNAVEPGCHLCFCQHNDTAAVCWPRGVRRCDAKHYHHFGRRKRSSRVRRSPGFSDIFFSDAAKDVFDKNTPEECKPYESSYSEGCPPADWCIGCTVCDCNANGRWDCHVLSFCPDEKGKKKMKKKRAKVGKRQGTKKAVSTTTKILNPITTQKPNKKSSPKNSNKPVKRNQRKVHKVSAKPQSESNKGKHQKVIPLRKPKATVYKTTPTPKIKNQANKIYISKSKNPPAVQLAKGKTNSFNEDAIVKNITETVLKKVMTSVEKMINERQKSNKNKTQAIQQKTIQKRSMSHFNNSKSRKNSSPKPTFKNVKKAPFLQSMKNKQNLKPNKSKRSKREIPAISSNYYNQADKVTYATDSNVTENFFVYHTLDNDIIFVTPIAKMLTRPSYFKYTVDLEKDNVNILQNLNGTRSERFLIPEITTNKLNEVTSSNADLKMNSFNEKTRDIKENNLKISSKDHTGNNFIKQFMNISNALIVNSAGNGDNITKKFENNFALKFNITCEKTCEFKKFLRKIVRFSNKNTTMPNDKIKTFNILKNLKKIFKKVYVTRKVKDNSTANIHQSTNKRNLIRNICKNFGYCKLDLKNKTLSSKMDELRAESKKIMTSIRSIKGLLKLLDIDSKKMKGNTTSINKQFSNKDIEILSAIIKDKYEEYNFANLTETQKIQVSYIKQNTKMFLQSLEKFAQILKDIVKILTNHKTPHSKVSNRYYRNLKNQAYSNVNKNNTIGEKLDKIKELLTNYNLVQNQFMKQMYDVIITLGPKQNQTTNNIKVINENKNNNSVAIEIYTQNIIKNLRKLKDLVQKLRLKNRRKREAMEDDDVVEYLLILMEYLLKQQKQLKISPVKDGIDLLIEAIKTAPDIKATRKKVLDYVPITDVEIGTTETTSAFLNTNEIVNEIVVTANPVISKFKTFESIDEDEEINDFYQYNKKVHKNSKIKKTKSETEDINSENVFLSLTTPSYYVTSSYLMDDEKSNAVLDKIDTKKKDDNKGFQVFADDTYEDDAISLTTTKSPDKIIGRESVKARLNGPMRTTPYYNLRDKQSMSKDSNDTYTSQHNRIQLDWIEDSYTQEAERKELPRFIETTTQKILPTHAIVEVATRTIRNKEKKVNKYDDPVSGISKETVDEDRKRSKYLNSEYVMYKKQMNLLNSLDYGTEKIELEVDSKEEKSNAESFPLYF